MTDVSPADAVEDVGAEADDTPTVEDATASHEAAEGAESSGRFGSRGALQDALLATDPNQPLETVDSPWNPEKGGVTRIYRGISKMLDFEGTPAIVDVVIGLAEFVVGLDDAEAESSNDETGGTEGYDEAEGDDRLV